MGPFAARRELAGLERAHRAAGVMGVSVSLTLGTKLLPVRSGSGVLQAIPYGCTSALHLRPRKMKKKKNPEKWQDQGNTLMQPF